MLPLLWISWLRGPECNQHQGGNKQHRTLEVPYWDVDARKGENVEAYVLSASRARRGARLPSFAPPAAGLCDIQPQRALELLAQELFERE